MILIHMYMYIRSGQTLFTDICIFFSKFVHTKKICINKPLTYNNKLQTIKNQTLLIMNNENTTLYWKSTFSTIIYSEKKNNQSIIFNRNFPKENWKIRSYRERLAQPKRSRVYVLLPCGLLTNIITILYIHLYKTRLRRSGGLRNMEPRSAAKYSASYNENSASFGIRREAQFRNIRVLCLFLVSVLKACMPSVFSDAINNISVLVLFSNGKDWR